MNIWEKVQNLSESQRTVILVSTILGVMLVGAGIIVSIISNNQVAPDDANAGTGSCNKFGVNFAIYTPASVDSYDRAKRLGMGYSLEIVNQSSQLAAMTSTAKLAHARGIIPIVRPCVGGSDCEFKDPDKYIDFLNKLADGVGGGTVYALSGPNEPISEPWTGGTVGDPISITPPLAAYMNKITAGVNKANLKLLTPAFNFTHAKFPEMIAGLKAAGADYTKIHAFTGNAYNMDATQTQAYFTAKVKKTMSDNGISKPIIFTESGLFEITNAVPKATALQNYARELNIMKSDSAIEAILIFNGFGNNPDTNFQYNNLSDADYAAVTGTTCISTTATPPPAPVPTGPTDGQCGMKCSTDADCNPSTTGVPVRCGANKTCENARCAPGKTTYGSRCDCADTAKRCGDPCGVTQGGLCGAGTVCRYITGPSCTTATAAKATTYCAPLNANGEKSQDLTNGRQAPTQNPKVKASACVAADTLNQYVIVEGQPSSMLNLTGAQIKTAMCEWCGNGFVDPGEQCDNGSGANGKSGNACSATCKKVTTTAPPPAPTPTPTPPPAPPPTPELPRTAIGDPGDPTLTLLAGAVCLIAAAVLTRRYLFNAKE